MSRDLISGLHVLVLVLGPAAAHASPAGAGSDATATADADADADADVDVAPVADRELGAVLGLALGGRVTPGGLRVEGHYLYQLSDADWFDGRVAFTIGGGPPACYRDRDDEVVCEHDKLDGVAIELGAGIRRWLTAQQGFAPWVSAGVALRYVRFGGDDVAGVALPVSAAAGVRARVTDRLAVGGHAALEVGPALLGRGLGLQPQIGAVVGATIEFVLP